MISAAKAFLTAHQSEPLVLLTLTQVAGSSYQPVGAFKWVAASRASHGMISGGCLEDHLIDLALARLTEWEANDGPYEIWHEVVDSMAPEDRLLGTGLGCRGRLTISFELMPAGSERRAKVIADQLRPRVTVNLIGTGLDVDPVVSLLAWRGWDALVWGHSAVAVEHAKARGLPCRLYADSRLAATLRQTSQHSPSIVVAMSHNFPKDVELLAFLSSMSIREQIALDYLGLLGSRQRSRDLLTDLRRWHGHDLAPQLAKVFHSPLGLAGFGKGEHAVALALVAELQSLFGDGLSSCLPCTINTDPKSATVRGAKSANAANGASVANDGGRQSS